MRTDCMMILIAWMGLFLLVTEVHGARKSRYDRERDRLLAEQQKRQVQSEIQKRQDEAREKKEKKQEEVRQINSEEYLRRHPAAFYNARLAGRYGMKDGKPVRFVPINGKVHGILDEKRVFVNVASKSGGAGEGSLAVVLVVLEQAQTFSRGDDFSVPNLVEAGTYGYSVSDGTSVKVKMYQQIPGMTLKEFLKLKENGYMFPEEKSG